MKTKLLQKATKILAESRSAVAMTGAGLSTESGIPDFRSPGGIWTHMDQKDFTYRYYVNDIESRIRYWKTTPQMYKRYKEALPHAGQQAFVELHRGGVIRQIITQNTDGMHQKAGYPKCDLIEIHGNSHWVKCLDCINRESRDSVNERVARGELPPYCQNCGGIQKTDVVFFGEGIPPNLMKPATQWANNADVFLVVGTSLVVQPVASLPSRAKSRGSRLIIINQEETPLDAQADVILKGRAGEILPQLAKAVLSERQTSI